MKVPSSFKLMGRTIAVSIVPELRDENGDECYGMCKWGEGWIKLCDGLEPSALLHAFFHEVQHLIFEASGKNKLSRDEGLVDSLAGLWQQALSSFKYAKAAPKKSEPSRPEAQSPNQ